jgi:hypothetical protein
MAQTAREIFVVGLRNAHAMETQARELMERQSERLDEYPEVKAKLTAHLQETNEQLKRLERCLDALGEGASILNGHHPVSHGQRACDEPCYGRRRDTKKHLREQRFRKFRNRIL